MDFFELKEGIIITFDQQDEFSDDGKIVKVIPANLFLVQSS
jgi:predicted AAA+ superfamily ATPase